MSLIRGFILFVLMIGLIMSTAWASETITLTLEESIAVALENNPDIKIAEKEVSKAKASVWEAMSVLMPSVTASANFQKSWEIQENTIPNFIKAMVGPTFPGYNEMPDFVRLSFGLENTFMYGLNLQQPLFLGGAGIAGVQLAQSAQQAIEHLLESKRQNLIYRTANAFYACLLTKELIRVQEEAMGQARANLEIVLSRYEVGSASGLDKMRAEVEVANLKPALITVRNDHQSALTGLRVVLGLEETKRVQVKGEMAYETDAMEGANLESLQQQAMVTRPELHMLTAQKRMASKGVTIARSSFMPKVYFSTDYSFLAMRNDYDFKQDDFSKGFTSAVSVSIPLFQGFRNHKQYQKARLDYKIVLDTEKQAGDGIAAEVEISFNKFQEGKEKYVAAQESIILAEEALRLANLMYEEGASTQLDVLISQLALTRARLNHVSALYEFLMARYALRRVTGTLTTVL